jgi:hypothetical protein
MGLTSRFAHFTLIINYYEKKEMKNKRLTEFNRIELVDWFNEDGLIPEKLEYGVFYKSSKYNTAIHLCACGCGNQTVTPIKTTNFGRNWDILDGWDYRTKKIDGTTEKDRPYDYTITLTPSIGNYNFTCKSHYMIIDSKIIWL